MRVSSFMTHLSPNNNPFKWQLADEGCAEYCTTCKIWHFDEGYGDGKLCEHVAWCEECGMWGGSGCEDGCECHTNIGPKEVSAY